MRKKAISFFTAVVLALSCLGLNIQPALAADYIAAEHTASNGKPYYIMVNRTTNTVTIYGLDDAGYYTVPVKAMVCSVGRKGSLTPKGNFSVTGYKRTWLHMVDGSYGQYATQFYGNYLFHSICYTKKDPSTLMANEYNMLGGPASLGCVRLQTADAKWIYDNCAAGTKVTIYDGNDPSPLGKPDKVVSEITPEMDNGWDPTDPRSENPWRKLLVSDVRLDKTKAALAVGETAVLTATRLPSTATVPADAVWSSSNTSVVKVDNSGKMTAVGQGTATVTAAYGKVSASCEVTVSGVLVTGVSLSRKEAALTAGESLKLTAAVSPSNATVPAAAVWSSSNPVVATVDNAGNVTAFRKGTTVITVSYGKVSAACKVTVSGVLVTGVSLNRKEAALTAGETLKLTAAVSPSDATVPAAAVWSSSNASVVKVDNNGELTAVRKGTATVTVAYGKVSAACKVTVSGVLVTGVSLSRKEAALTAGEELKLTATVSPSDATIPAAAVWSSSDPKVATVDDAGNVTAYRTGTTVITAAYGKVSASCKVTVSGVLVTGASISQEEAALTAGETLRLTVTTSPSDATIPAAAVWSSSDPKVATVDDAGNVTALLAGTAVITAAYGKVSAACTVTVSGQLLPFADVVPGVWYYSDVRYVYESGLLTGTGENTFSPKKPVTYAMTLQVLYRMSGAGQDGAAGQKGDAWYSAAFRWAAGKGLLNGMTESGCDPNGQITRQELAALLYRYETVLRGRPASGFASLSDFPDNRGIYLLARDAMSWAIGNGLFQRVSGEAIRPSDYVDRAQLVAILHRYNSISS